MYESFYGLSGKPFQLTPDPTFFFASRGHKRAFAYLEYGVSQGEGFIVITGEVGAGKTTVVRSLLERLDRKRVMPALLVSTQLKADELLRAVAEAFKLPGRLTDKAQLLTDLERYLVSLASQGKRALLIVDEAQNLSGRAMEELRMLSNFQLGGRALLQSFLVGQPELRDIMRSPELSQLRQRVVAACHLGPLDRDETRQYVDHRLNRVGWSGDPEFTEDAIDALYAFTNGIPRRINTLCDRLLLLGYLGEQHAFSASDVTVVIEEIEEEVGGEGAEAVVGASAAAPQADDEEMVGERERLSQSRPDLRPAKSGLGQSSLTSAVEERVTRLEKSMAALVAAMHRLIRASRDESPSQPRV